MTDKELLPCPFCGQVNEIVTTPYYLHGAYTTECQSCEAEGPAKSTRNEARQAWNTRANKAVPDEVLSKLDELLEQQKDHYGEMHVLSSSDKGGFYRGEKEITEGVITGIEYCIEALKAMED